ncbi:uncharacterized protein PHALS_13248 [Plasmopara halstedii]|uniref:Uncharacterized protein n=1 Tax=Plasmopara halstedii TaxID=4781 RepID=A0A0P1AP99_PLAHL|nr:uncharacterized protein PHALS_13248 [Plasmopara halstedii]CEG43023.1 hypothetical protein PHALS_13248 [Plasmopara halstedii]|eukprot:XP_024579392.1 hypothetical protein PHALS_13248 [Plasmopara halstedii]
MLQRVGDSLRHHFETAVIATATLRNIYSSPRSRAATRIKPVIALGDVLDSVTGVELLVCGASPVLQSYSISWDNTL